MITNCTKIEKSIMDDISRSQIWNCPNGTEILDACKYHVIATDMLAAGLDYKERAEIASIYLYKTMDANSSLVSIHRHLHIKTTYCGEISVSSNCLLAASNRL